MFHKVADWITSTLNSRSSRSKRIAAESQLGTKRKREADVQSGHDCIQAIPEGVLTHMFQLMARSEDGLQAVRSARLVCRRWRLAATEVLLEDTAASRPPPPAMACKSATTDKARGQPTRAAATLVLNAVAEGGVEVSSMPAEPDKPGRKSYRAVHQRSYRVRNTVSAARGAGPGWLPPRQPGRRSRKVQHAVPEGAAESIPIASGNVMDGLAAPSRQEGGNQERPGRYQLRRHGAPASRRETPPRQSKRRKLS